MSLDCKLCLVGFQARTFFLHKEPGDIAKCDWGEITYLVGRQMEQDRRMGKI